MQQPTRGSSRARRSGSIEAPAQRTPTTPSSSSTAISPRFHAPSSIVRPFFTTLSFFAAATNHAPLIALPAFLVALVIALIPSRPSKLISIVQRARAFIAPLSLLYTVQVVSALYAVRLLGPARALIALAAPNSLPRQPRRYFLHVLLPLLALSLLAYDACGGTAPNHRATRVRDKVLHSPAIAAVHSRLQDLSRTVESRYEAHRRRRQARRAGRKDDAGQVDLPIDLVPPLEPQQPRLRSLRRRLLAIVKGQSEIVSNEEAEAGRGSTSEVDKNLKAQDRPPSHASRKRQDTDLDQIPSAPREDSHAESGRASNENNSLLESGQTEADGVSLQDATASSTLKAVLGVILAVCSSVACASANELKERALREIGDMFSLYAVIFLCCSATLFPFFLMLCALINAHGEPLWNVLVIEVLPRGAVFGISFLFAPLLLQQFLKDSFRRQQGSFARGRSKSASMSYAPMFSFSLLQDDFALPRTLALYMFILLSTNVLKKLQLASTGMSYPLTFSSYLAALILLLTALVQAKLGGSSTRRDSGTRERVGPSISGSMSRSLKNVRMPRIRQAWKIFNSTFVAWVQGVREVFVHAKSNKASWQVLNFLVLQSGMVSVELLYAAATDSKGLISISADNFFCSIALAIGLLAIRVTNRKPTSAYTYGFSRFESLCGFANGVMLVYVGVLIVLEAFERMHDNDSIEMGRVFTVCLFGMTGNVLGLYFFPPESRRENHNVQGIYLHIWANTLAFASMAISTAITAAVPSWEPFDMIASTVVGTSIILRAAPLVVRSARLLLLLAPSEKKETTKSLGNRLSDIEGVVKVSTIRLWNMTPTCLVASAKIELSDRYKGDEMEVLHKARAIFASVGVPASQCTVQITRVESDAPAVIFFHRRTRSGLKDTGIDIERLAISRQNPESNQLTIQASSTFPNS